MIDAVSFFDYANKYLWGIPALIFISAAGVYFTICTNFVQIRKFKTAIKNTFGKMFEKGNKKDGTITPFQALCTALAATVGTGNIACIAGAVALGGPGVVFWLIVSSFLGMPIKFAEIATAVKFRQKTVHGEYAGGPMYSIKNGLGPQFKILAVIFSLCGAIAVFGTGNLVQVNTMIDSLKTISSVKQHITYKVVFLTGVVFALLTYSAMRGGIKSISAVTQILIPFMAAGYVILCTGAVIYNFNNIIPTLKNIIIGAFNPKAVTGGVVCSAFTCIQSGFARGIFSNEAGLGTASIAHAGANSTPVKQGYFGIAEVFADTTVICTLTAFTILTSGVNIEYGIDAGAELTINALKVTFGSFAPGFITVCLFMFAFSTVIGWGFYGVRCVEFLLGEKSVKIFTAIYSAAVIAGCTAQLKTVWSMSQFFNGIMIFPNLIHLFLLSPQLIKTLGNSKEK